MEKAKSLYPDLSDRLRGLPNELAFGDLFSGTGSCAIAINTLFRKLSSMFEDEMEHTEASSSLPKVWQCHSKENVHDSC